MKTLLLLTLLVSFSTAQARSTPDTFTQQADAFFRQYVKEGKVDYARLKKNGQELEHLFRQLGPADLSKAPDNVRKAFYLNAYNLLVIYQVVHHFPVKSPMDIKGFFDQTTFPVAGQNLTLNALEKTKLIQPFRDPRVHFALVCAAKGCPSLASFAYLPDKLDTQLNKRTTLSLNDAYFIRVDKSRQKAEVSQIFEWYQADFTAAGQSVLAFINQYRREKIPAQFALSHYEYDWSLNSQ